MNRIAPPLHQANLIETLKNDVQALSESLESLESHWAYMVTASLAWRLKVRAALLLPETGRWAEERYRKA